MKVITFRIEIPDGATVHFGDEDVGNEPLPPPWQVPFDDSAEVRTVVTAHGASAGCPVHHLPWRTVPAGVSKKSGLPYASFMTCVEPTCRERPPTARRSAS